jgi:hypothetical protein
MVVDETKPFYDLINHKGRIFVFINKKEVV